MQLVDVIEPGNTLHGKCYVYQADPQELKQKYPRVKRSKEEENKLQSDMKGAMVNAQMEKSLGWW